MRQREGLHKWGIIGELNQSIMRHPLILSFAFTALWLIGCSSGTREVSEDTSYSALRGARYRTVVDLYLFGSPEQKPIRFLGINDGDLTKPRAATLPRTVSREHIGKRAVSDMIFDVVPAGTEVIISRIYHSITPNGNTVWAEGNLHLSGTSYRAVSLQFIQFSDDGRNGGQPEIDPLLAERIN